MRAFKSPRARRRMLVLAVVTPVLALAVGLTLWAMREQVTFFYSPAEAAEARVEPGVMVRLGGLVEEGSVQQADGVVRFSVTDGEAATPVRYEGDLPDLFREGQGVVVQGAFLTDGSFEASEVLAKHDETYMPREVAESLKRRGRWREGEVASNS
ncbi:cytochrome c maturation protein CcmE [Brevundimonas sp.]|uniref:cytochrome c maturation protein CcmE n=1 Tax=Brevundimonas sp. TaxID=1871086 RepID=UPI0025D46527|nr:cytochrome c maturation protein CcmE [Brevundimonas sp.]